MTIESDLEPKLVTIARLARERFEYDLDKATGFELGDDDRVGVDGGHGQSPRTSLISVWQQKFNVMVNDLDSICTKVRGFYVYDALDLRLIARRFSSTSGNPAGGSIDVDTGAASVVGRLNYASANYVQKVDAMLHADLWQGEAAGKFQTNFVDRLITANALQTGYAWALALVVQMLNEGLVKLGEALNDIADSCITVLPPESHNPKAEAAGNLGYASIITGAISLVPFPPLAIPAGFASLAAGISGTYLGVTAGGPEQRHPPVWIEGDSAIEILESTWTAITGVDASIVDLDSKISQVVGDLLDNPDGFADRDLDVANPSVTSWPSSKITAGQPGPIDQNPLVISVRDVYNAGYTLLPGAAQEYDAAVGIIGATELATNLGVLFPRTVVEYADARGRLGRILTETSGTVTDVGAALVDVTSKYEMTDAEQAELFRQTGELTVPEPRFTQDPHPVHGAY